MDDQLLRRIPKVDELLRDPLLAGCCRTLPQQLSLIHISEPTRH